MDQREGEGRGKWHVEWFSQVVEDCVGSGGGEVGVRVTKLRIRVLKVASVMGVGSK